MELFPGSQRGRYRICVSSENWKINDKSKDSTYVQFERALQLIDDTEKQRILKFFRIEDKKSALIGRLILNSMICSATGISNRDLVWHRTDKGKPYIDQECLETMQKLILVLVLAVISFARPSAQRLRPNDNDVDSTQLYYFAEQMNDDLIVTIDTVNEQDGLEYTGKVKKINIDPLFKTSTPAASSFQIFTNEQAEQLTAFYMLNHEEEECGLVYDYYKSSLNTFLGFASYAYQGSDKAPSITALVANSPNYIRYTDTSITPQELYQEKSCGGTSAPEGGVYYYNEYYTSFAIEKFGILDFECVPNTIVPQSKVTSCTNTSSSNLPTLKGYRIGVALNQSASDIKDLILRFGPVLRVHFRNKYMIIIGWRQAPIVDRWLVLVMNLNHYFFVDSFEISNYEFFDVLVVFNLDDADKCVEITASTPVSQCPCLTTSDPRDACKTPATVDCTKTPTDAACAEDCEDNTKKTITECACVVGDKRDACKGAGKDASGSVRVVLGVIAAAVVLPVIALFC
ncbi:MAG: hypothetical protein EZS28_004034 [Streblomastix strix]|uniref:holo-[acyl-carrier-protein] synthase n=1 Tax=Streblomastix strix TaxID=222440 RepID=A0A5J4WZL5_9EUKA|nr:MAG: hypothetical protein EZS28_004034 [Streblomastix strix]